eukprot:TRINITY_DN3231_c0_g2_i3.p1 TRINITY_DN3231_c0_g2~~TRINITY_DN3231_c0_g2_i3.p1  ORF type:complete len:216 (-),score=6.39 TRINITY_DN3231_c0_g2_i3:110-757(-)
MKMPDLTRRRLLILLAIMSLGLIVWTKRLDLVFFLSRGMDTTYRVKLPFCDCYRDTKLSRSDRNVFRTSSCPMSALRGSGQRILSYSFFDDPHTSDTLNRNFFKGIKENLDGIREQYNSHTFDLRGQKKGSLFSMRVYFQLHSTSKPLVPRLGLTHDSYHCRKYPGGSAFPSNRPFGPLNFVGAVADINNTLEFSAKNECPFKCRPKEHKDWAFC